MLENNQILKISEIQGEVYFVLMTLHQDLRLRDQYRYRSHKFEKLSRENKRLFIAAIIHYLKKKSKINESEARSRPHIKHYQ